MLNVSRRSHGGAMYHDHTVQWVFQKHSNWRTARASGRCAVLCSTNHKIQQDHSPLTQPRMRFEEKKNEEVNYHLMAVCHRVCFLYCIHIVCVSLPFRSTCCMTMVDQKNQTRACFGFLSLQCNWISLRFHVTPCFAVLLFQNITHWCSSLLLLYGFGWRSFV